MVNLCFNCFIRGIFKLFKERFLAIFYGFSLIINIKSIQKLFFNENSRQLFNKNYALSIACRLKQQHKFIENCQKSLVRNDYIILLETMAYRNIKKYDKAWQCIKEIKSTTR